MTEPTGLRRSLSLTHAALYGLGTTVGAGIYALIGEMAGVTGMYMPISFLLASLLVGFSGLSFAEMAARYPQSAGESVYVKAGFGWNWLSIVVGLMVVAAAMVSSAAIVNGFVGYLGEFVDIPDWLAITGLVSLLAVLVAWGIAQSVTVAALLTLVEVGGLLLVIWAGREGLATLPVRWPELVPPAELPAFAGILAGTFLAFYAFIGFEDMVNVAEEVKDAEHMLPLAIAVTLIATLLLYLGVSLTAVLNASPAELQATDAPLAFLYARGSGGSGNLIGAIGILAVVNGALIQMIMASRVLYGMARQKLLPAVLGRVHPRTQTPLEATAMVTGAVLLAALAFPLVTLAQATSFITLTIFALVNLALIRVKRRAPAPPGIRTWPIWVPLAGFAVSAAFLIAETLRLLAG